VELMMLAVPGCGEEPGSAPGHPAAADVSCGCINFFTTRNSAAAWALAHPGVTGQILGQADAVRLSAQIFGALLGREPGPSRKTGPAGRLISSRRTRLKPS
jgi:hypothetical protein